MSSRQTRLGHRFGALVLGLAAVSVSFAGSASAYWSTTGKATAAAAADTILAPATVTATADSSTQITISVTAGPSTGPAATAFKIMRGANTVCASVALNAACVEGSLTATTQYTYDAYSRVGTSWVSAQSKQIQQTTAATPISTPTITSPTAASPLTVGHGNTATLNIVGTGFVSGATVSFPGGHFTGGTVTFTDSSHLSLTVTAVNNSKGNDRVTVTNPDTGAASSAAASLVNN